MGSYSSEGQTTKYIRYGFAFFMHGLRLPEKGLSLAHQRETVGTKKEEMDQSIFTLTGQQFDIPEDPKPFSIALDNPDNLGWIVMEQERG